jgi:hypothetical protein
LAEIFPDEGLDLILGVIPKGGTTPATTYLTLFTTFTASTVGTAGQTRSAYTEPSGGAFARQSIAAASWGAQGAGTGGRLTTAAQVTFPTATAVWGTINGFALGDTSTAGSGKLYFACNFDDVTSVTVNTNDIVKVTPTWQANS